MKRYYSGLVQYPSRRTLQRLYEGLVKTESKQVPEQSLEEYNRELRENRVSLEQVNRIADMIGTSLHS